MKKQTAIEEAIELANENLNTSNPNWWWKRKLIELLSKERKQIIDARKKGDYICDTIKAEQYYNETFKKK